MLREMVDQAQGRPAPVGVGGQTPADNGGQVNELPANKQVMAENIMKDASKLYDNMLDPVMKSDNPAKTAGDIVGKTFHMLLRLANDKGVKIPQDVSQAVSLEMLDDILDMAEEAGKISPKSDAERVAMFKRGVSELGLKYVEEEGMSRDFDKKRQGVEQAYVQSRAQGGQPTPQGQPAPQAPQEQPAGGPMQRQMGG